MSRAIMPAPGALFGIWRFVREASPEPINGTQRGVFACTGCGGERVKPIALLIGGRGPVRCRDCIGKTTRAAAAARAATRAARRETEQRGRSLPLVGGHMLRGQGDRRETCASYGACLNAARREAPQGAHCPKGCEHFRPVRLELETYGRSPIAAAQDHAVGFLGVSYGRVSKAA